MLYTLYENTVLTVQLVLLRHNYVIITSQFISSDTYCREENYPVMMTPSEEYSIYTDTVYIDSVVPPPNHPKGYESFSFFIKL